jgi:nickel superoxide dismutase
MNQITELSAAGEKNYNQLVRWVSNKEEHADEFQHIVSQYFLHQRIKPAGVDDADYVRKLTLLHEMLVTAMKCKQTTDLENTAKLRSLIDAFAEAYFSPEDFEHLQEHRN